MRRIVQIMLLAALLSSNVLHAYAQTTPAPSASASGSASLGQTSGSGIIDPTATLDQNLTKLYTQLMPVMALLAFLAIVYAGYIYITSIGKPDRINEAKSWLISALVGLAFYLLIPVILSFLSAPGPFGAPPTSPLPSGTPVPNDSVPVPADINPPSA